MTTYDDPTRELTVVVHPRIRQRWVDNRRLEGRRRLRFMVVAGGVVLALALATGLAYSPLLGARQVTVGGAGSLTGAVEAAAAVGHRPLVEIHPGEMAARIEAIPLVGTATVGRQWPTTVRIRVTLRTPVAQAQVNGQILELDATGRVLATQVAANPNLPLITGLPAAGLAPGAWVAGGAGPAGRADPTAQWLLADPADVTLAAIAVSANLPAILVGRVESISVTGGTLTATMASGAGSSTLQVLLGDQTQLAAKLTALATLVEKVDLSGVAQVDVRVPYRPLLTPLQRRG